MTSDSRSTPPTSPRLNVPPNVKLAYALAKNLLVNGRCYTMSELELCGYEAASRDGGRSYALTGRLS